MPKIGSKQMKLRKSSEYYAQVFFRKCESEVNQTERIFLRMKILGEECVMYVVNAVFREELRMS